jgi:hypothetical protein
MTAVLIDEHVHEKVFNDRIAELLALFLNMKAVYPVYHSRKAWVLDKLIL